MIPSRRGTLAALGLFTLLVAGPLLRGTAQEEKPDPELIAKEKMAKLLAKAEEEYRLFLKRPTTAPEFWAAMKFEISVGKFDLAGLHLKLLLAKEPKEDVNKALVAIEAAEGMSQFLRLRKIERWSNYPPYQEEAKKNVEDLIERTTQAVREHLKNDARLSKFIKQLGAPTIEERAFALAQLDRSKEAAVPALVRELRLNAGKALGHRIYDALLRLDSSTVPAFLEVFKANDAKDAAEESDLRLTLLDVVRHRRDVRAVPYLWHLSAAEMYPKVVRERARATLAALLNVDETVLPPAKVALTQLAERYYEHRVRFPVGRPIRVWNWSRERSLATEPVALTPHQAEEFFGRRYAREALDLDPTYVPAQTIFLSLTLERAFEKNLDQFLLRPMPAGVRDLLASIDAELVARVLERGLDEHKLAVILPTVTALGERGDARAARLNSAGTPRGLVRALYHPDRRVQLAAARAMLKMPAQPPVASTRVVDIFRQFLGDDGSPRALAAYVPAVKAAPLRAALKAADLDVAIASDLRELAERGRNSTGFDVIVLYDGLTVAQLPFVLTQLRADADLGALPTLVIASKDREELLAPIVKRYRNAVLLPEVLLKNPDELKKAIHESTHALHGPKLSATERKALARVALDALWRMARGELVGYDVRPAQEALLFTLRSPEDAVTALETLGRLPGSDVQQRLAGLALDPSRGKLRIPAAIELNRHLQKYGVLLPKRQLEALRTAYRGAAEPALKAQLALAVGALRTGPRRTGTALIDYRPAPPTPPPDEKKGKEKEKE